MDARGSELNVSVRAKGREDYVQKWENDEPDGFEDALTFPVRDVETGHRVAALLPYLIEEAGKATIEAGSLSWLAEAVAERKRRRDDLYPRSRRRQLCVGRYRRGRRQPPVHRHLRF